jgi:hypothetical protein
MWDSRPAAGPVHCRLTLVRLFRRSAAVAQSSVHPLPRAAVNAWGEWGYVHASDQCAEEGVGTLRASESSWLAPALARGARRRLAYAGSGVGAIALGGVLLGPALASGLAALLLIALAHGLLMAAHAAPRQPLSALPREPAALARHERLRVLGHVGRSLFRASAICAVAGLAAAPGTAASLAIALFGLLSWAASRVLVL